MKNKLEIVCPNCHETLLCCKTCGFATSSTKHGQHNLRKHHCIHNTKVHFQNFDSITTYKHQIEPDSKKSVTSNESTVLNPLTTSNEFSQDHYDSNDIYFNNNSDGAIVCDFNSNTTRCHSNENGEVNLQPEDFYYLNYPHESINGNNTCIFNSTNSRWKFFGRNTSACVMKEN